MALYKLSEVELETMRLVEKIIGTDYELEEACIPCEYLINAIEELLTEIESLNDKLKELENDINENYRPLTYKDLIGYKEKDFI